MAAQVKKAIHEHLLAVALKELNEEAYQKFRLRITFARFQTYLATATILPTPERAYFPDDGGFTVILDQSKERQIMVPNSGVSAPMMRWASIAGNATRAIYDARRIAIDEGAQETIAKCTDELVFINDWSSIRIWSACHPDHFVRTFRRLESEFGSNPLDLFSCLRKHGIIDPFLTVRLIASELWNQIDSWRPPQFIESSVASFLQGLAEKARDKAYDIANAAADADDLAVFMDAALTCHLWLAVSSAFFDRLRFILAISADPSARDAGRDQIVVEEQSLRCRELVVSLGRTWTYWPYLVALAKRGDSSDVALKVLLREGVESLSAQLPVFPRIVKEAWRQTLDEDTPEPDERFDFDQAAFRNIGARLVTPDDIAVAADIEMTWNRHATQITRNGGPMEMLRESANHIHTHDPHSGDPITRHELGHHEQIMYQEYLNRMLGPLT